MSLEQPPAEIGEEKTDIVPLRSGDQEGIRQANIYEDRRRATRPYVRPLAQILQFPSGSAPAVAEQPDPPPAS